MSAQKTPAKPVAHLYVGGIYGDEFQDWDLVAERGLCDLLNEQHFANGKEARIPLYASPQPAAQQPVAVPEWHQRLQAQVKHMLDDLVTEETSNEGLAFYSVDRNMLTSNMFLALSRMFAEPQAAALAAAPQAPSREPLDIVMELIEEAFRDGFNAPQTYNDHVENTADDEWAKLRDTYLVYARAHGITKEGGRQ